MNQRPRTHRLTRLGCAALAVASAAGCAPRTVLVTDGAPMRIGRDAAARVYTLQDGQWRMTEQPVPLPEGWYLVSPRWVDEEATP